MGLLWLLSLVMPVSWAWACYALIGALCFVELVTR